jgi:hypothetical protein
MNDDLDDFYDLWTATCDNVQVYCVPGHTPEENRPFIPYIHCNFWVPLYYDEPYTVRRKKVDKLEQHVAYVHHLEKCIKE